MTQSCVDLVDVYVYIVTKARAVGCFSVAEY